MGVLPARRARARQQGAADLQTRESGVLKYARIPVGSIAFTSRDPRETPRMMPPERLAALSGVPPTDLIGWCPFG